MQLSEVIRLTGRRVTYFIIRFAFSSTAERWSFVTVSDGRPPSTHSLQRILDLIVGDLTQFFQLSTLFQNAKRVPCVYNVKSSSSITNISLFRAFSFKRYFVLSRTICMTTPVRRPLYSKHPRKYAPPIQFLTLALYKFIYLLTFT